MIRDGTLETREEEKDTEYGNARRKGNMQMQIGKESKA